MECGHNLLFLEFAGLSIFPLPWSNQPNRMVEWLSEYLVIVWAGRQLFLGIVSWQPEFSKCSKSVTDYMALYNHQDSRMQESERNCSGSFTIMANGHKNVLLPVYATDNFDFVSKASTCLF